MANPLKGVAEDGKATKIRPALSFSAKLIGLGGVVGVLGISGAFAAPVNFVGDIFLTAGKTSLSECVSNSSVSFTQVVNSSGQTEVDSVTIEGIPAACDGEIVSLVIYDSSSTILDEIIWTLDLTTGDNGITAVADGILTSASNSTSSGISTNYPASQTDPEGLEQNVRASNVDRLEFLVLDASRAARE